LKNKGNREQDQLNNIVTEVENTHDLMPRHRKEKPASLVFRRWNFHLMRGRRRI